MTIRELAKKSLLLKRFVWKYRHARNQPVWEPILNEERQFWDSVLEQAGRGRKILIATSVGSFLPGTTLESMLAVALTLRGADVHLLLCDAVLPACFSCWSDLYPNHEKFSQEGPGNHCAYCFEPAYKMYESLGLSVHRYSEFLGAQEIEKAGRIASSVAVQDIGHYRIDEIAAGEHALAGALRFFGIGMLNGEPYGEQILRRYLNASLLTVFVTTNMLKKWHFSSVVFHHGIYVPQGLIGEVCRKNNIHVVNWNPGYRKRCFIFSHEDTYHHTMVTESTEQWINIPWNGQLESKLMEYLKSRWYGTEDWIWFHNRKPQFEFKTIASELGIDSDKPCVGMLTSVIWDAVLHYPSNVFDNMLEWVRYTINYFIERTDIQLVIRIHPAEVRGTLPSRQRIADEIESEYPDLPEHIIVIPAQSNVSTYTVMAECDSVIIYNTKTGVELTAMGIPVIVAGEAWVRNKGFALDVSDADDYRHILDRLPLGKRMSRDDVLKARKYAYHFFFRRMIPLEFMEPTGKVPPYRINLPNLAGLARGASKGLDLICDGILNHEDFILG